MSEHEKGYMPPMTGAEAFAMFGDRRLLTLEEQLVRLQQQMKDLTDRIADAESDPDQDPEETEKMRLEWNAMHEMLKEHNKVIRKAQKEFGEKRGPVTLH